MAAHPLGLYGSKTRCVHPLGVLANRAGDVWFLCHQDSSFSVLMLKTQVVLSSESRISLKGDWMGSAL
ncbi:hypothetical protein LCGC14_2514190 [marine sediment metagenome]|uniref:Uncharacterized protein n=1 Tax=marine sediment metagenome TaxID=412755 RepID=A0A0F9AYS3_9ZZZZ